MPALTIRRSISVDAGAAKVYQIVSDFTRWQVWSPWLIMEKEAEVIVDPDRKHYSWKGKRVGSGEMTITRQEPNHRIDYDLTFLTPFKSHAKIAFELQERGKQTEVSWLMDSKLPFFMFWMKKAMTAFMNSDYDRGLQMLKEYAEKDTVNSRLEILGVADFPETHFVGLRRKAPMSDMAAAMSEDFGKLEAYAKKIGMDVQGSFSQYHKWDIVRQEVEYTSAFIINAPINNPDPNFAAGVIPGTKVYKVRHTGPYHYLGNMWAMGMNLKQNKVFKSSKKIDPFEVYVNSPANAKPEELITEVNFPIR